MSQLAEILFWVLVALVVVQAAVTVALMVWLSRFRRPLLTDNCCPRAAVVLCVRGLDPFLPRCLEAILDQDYPDFELRIIVDHALDPARSIVDEIVSQRPAPNVVVQELIHRRQTCSLKCSSLVQAVETCDESIAMIAQLDADTVPHRTWLRELATALADRRVGAATGNRWYMPQQPTFGSLIRYAWNAAAVVQMYCHRIAWGGTLAIKTQVIREAGLLDRWSRSFCEDTMLFRFLREDGWKLSFVPSLMMINRETCDVASFRPWVQRQLLTARLYHPRWWAVVAHGLVSTLALLLAILLLLVSIGVQNQQAIGWLTAGLILYQGTMFLLLFPVEWLVRRIAGARQEPTSWLGTTTLAKLLLAIPATQFIYPLTLAAAMRSRLVEWRGISYEVLGPWDIRLVEYRPFESGTCEAASTVSL